MKRIFMATLMLVTSSSVFAQTSKYVTAMQENLQKMSAATSAEDYQKVAAAFERIANAEKDKWQPYYYACLSQIRSGMIDAKADKDAIAMKVESMIDKQAKIAVNSELYELKYMNATMQMMVNPMQRWQTKGKEAQAAYDEGILLNPNNPRLYFLKAMSVLNTPEQFGGGPKAAKPLFEKAVDAAKLATKSTDFSPNWGGEDAQMILDKIKDIQ